MTILKTLKNVRFYIDQNYCNKKDGLKNEIISQIDERSSFQEVP